MELGEVVTDDGPETVVLRVFIDLEIVCVPGIDPKKS